MKDILLFEEFNPNEEKKKLADRLDRVKANLNLRKVQLNKAAKSKNATRIQILDTKNDIDELEVKRILLKNKVIDLRIKAAKERSVNAEF